MNMKIDQRKISNSKKGAGGSLKKNDQRLTDLRETIKHFNMSLMAAPEGEEILKMAETLPDKITA